MASCSEPVRRSLFRRFDRFSTCSHLSWFNVSSIRLFHLQIIGIENGAACRPQAVVVGIQGITHWRRADHGDRVVAGDGVNTSDTKSIEMGAYLLMLET